MDRVKLIGFSICGGLVVQDERDDQLRKSHRLRCLCAYRISSRGMCICVCVEGGGGLERDEVIRVLQVVFCRREGEKFVVINGVPS